MNPKKCFEILHLERDASLEEAKQSYKRLVRLWHPDQYGNFPDKQKLAHEKLKQINVAYREVVSFLKSGTFSPKASSQDSENKPPSFRNGLEEKNGRTFWKTVISFLMKKPGAPGLGRPKGLYHPLSASPSKSDAVAQQQGKDFHQTLQHALRSSHNAGSSGNKINQAPRIKISRTYRKNFVTGKRSGDRVEKINPIGPVRGIDGNYQD